MFNCNYLRVKFYEVVFFSFTKSNMDDIITEFVFRLWRLNYRDLLLTYAHRNIQNKIDAFIDRNIAVFKFLMRTIVMCFLFSYQEIYQLKLCQ